MPSGPAPPAGPRVLVHLPNWLGDVVMSTPLLDLLDRAFAPLPPPVRPRLHVAVRAAWAPLFRDDPRLAGVVEIEREGRHGGLRGLARLAADLRRDRYEAVLLGPPSLRAGLTARLAGIPWRIGHAGDGRSPLLRPALPRRARGERHYAREMLDLGHAALAILKVPAPGRPDGDLPSASLPGCAGWTAAPAPADRPLWVVAPGTTYGEAKTWPAQQVGAFIDLAVGDEGARVVLVGDQGAAGFVARLREASGWRWAVDWSAAADVVDLTGRTDLRQVVGVLRAARLFVGNDSGLMHVAGALGVPTIGIFGSSNPDWTRPLGPRTAAVTATGFACRPCYRRTCNQPRFCLETVAAASVRDRARTLLADDNREGRPTR